jgi:arylformamidase
MLKSTQKMRALCAVIVMCAPILHTCMAGPLRDRLLERRAQQEQRDTLGDGVEGPSRASLPANVHIIRDVAYGSDRSQRFDVYAPQQAHGAPVIFMVHGGAWVHGDKAARAVIENKVARWVPRGFVVVSINYRMLPNTAPLEQAKDVARALAAAQDQAASWGGDRTKFILMGHSAGSHLVSLLSVSPLMAREFGAAPWLGTVALDSAALDVVQLMQAKHLRLYDRAFGQDADYWRAASPFHTLAVAAQPMLLVCSIPRATSCAQAARFAAKATSLGMQAAVLQQDLSHKEINRRLGEKPQYTEAVESFLRGLDQSVAMTLDARTAGSGAAAVSRN